MLERAVQVLADAQNADGGWGAFPGRPSNTEATSLAVLAIETAAGEPAGFSVERGVQWLVTRQHRDGSWPLTPGFPDASWATPLAILCLTTIGGHHPRALEGARWLLAQRGRSLGWLASVVYRVAPSRMPTRLNPDLSGWPWSRGAFSWVEPTSWALLALKRMRPHLDPGRARARILEGEQLVYDRMCTAGGWNYGNSNVLGVDAPPYADTTALALIALQDRPNEPGNAVSLDALVKMLTGIDSGLTLALAVLCLSMYGREVGPARQRLASTYERTAFLGETRALALGILAASDAPRGLRL
jgi:Squalene-hopene cyclase C-terminal domain